MEIINVLILGGVVGGLISFILLKVSLKRISLQLPSKEELLKELRQLDWEGELNPLVLSKIDQYTENLKNRLPMAAMILKGSFLEVMREQARQDILSVIPELQEKVVDTFFKKKELQIMLQRKILMEIQKMQKWIILAGGFIGAVAAQAAIFL